MMPHPRITVGGILTECNHFGGLPIDLESFRANELFRGDEMLGVTTSVVGGMLSDLRRFGAKPIPLLFASACPGGPVSRPCYDELKNDLLSRLMNVYPVDGVLLPLHGAALVDGVDDPEGDLLVSIRDVVGPETPVVVTLDLHAHVTEAMVQSADAMLAWETYPHRDQFSTGQRAAKLLLQILAGSCRPTMAMGKVPVITSAIHGSTDGEDPFAQLMRYTKSLEVHARVLSTSLFLIHPYMDAENMGSGGLVVTNDDEELAVELAAEIASRYWDRRHDLEPATCSPQEAIERGNAIDGGPILLVETSDCCGGGAAGDSIATLSALVANDADTSLVPVVDPDAAAECHGAGVGANLTLSLGHKLDPKWGQPQSFSGIVERLSDGRFEYTGGQWEGLQAEMGPSAVFTIGHVRVLITSRATYDWSDEQFRSVDLDASASKFIVAKNPMNYRWAYGDIAKETLTPCLHEGEVQNKAVFILDTPGPTPPTMRHIELKKLKRPYFPLDLEIANLQPTILKRQR